MLGLRLPSTDDFQRTHERDRRRRREPEEDLPRGEVRSALRTGAGHGRERLHVLQVQSSGVELSASDGMQETVQRWLQDQQTRLPCEYNFRYVSMIEATKKKLSGRFPFRYAAVGLPARTT